MSFNEEQEELHVTRVWTRLLRQTNEVPSLFVGIIVTRVVHSNHFKVILRHSFFLLTNHASIWAFGHHEEAVRMKIGALSLKWQVNNDQEEDLCHDY